MTSHSLAERASEQNSVELDESKIDAIFDSVNSSHRPGVAVGISHRGRPVYRRGFGLASLELPVVLTPSIRIRIGSTTKHFACLTYLLLCEKGLAGIDDPVLTYIPELGPHADGVTVRHLMTHTSGLHNVTAIISQFSGFINSQPLRNLTSSQDVIEMYASLDSVEAEPGATWRYNNGAYVLLSVLIERIAGRPLAEVMEDLLFVPLGMYDTTLRHWDHYFDPYSATGHHQNSDGSYIRGYHGYSYSGGGAISSTVTDMLRWVANMREPRVGSEQSWALMTEPHRLASGASTGYGLGLMVEDYRGARVVHHGGGWVGTRTQMLRAPDADLDVVIMANCDDVATDLLTFRVLDACLPGLNPVATSTARSQVSGLYKSKATGCVVELKAEDEAQIAVLDGNRVVVEPDPDGVLRPAGSAVLASWIGLKLDGDSDNRGHLRLQFAGTTDVLEPVDQSDCRVEPPPEGIYSAVGGRIESVVERSGSARIMRFTTSFGSSVCDLSPLLRGVWRASSRSELSPVFGFDGGIVSFWEQGDGFTYSSMKVKGLAFRRA